MTRLIDAGEIKKREHDVILANGAKHRCFDTTRLYEIPTVDAVPVRHGKWIKHEYAEESEGMLISNYECSECHTWERKESDYCPNCGADMRGV